MLPYLDLVGQKRRSVFVRPSEYDECERVNPGFVDTSIQTNTSVIHSRLIKGYGNSPEFGNAVPFGQSPPPLTAQGTTPPAVTLIGRPALGCLELGINIVGAGGLGVATFEWSKFYKQSNPAVFSAPIVLAPIVALPGTGMSAQFPDAAYAIDNVYTAPTCVLEAILRWLAIMVQWDVRNFLGFKPADPSAARLEAAFEQAMGFLKEAADGNAGLIELRTNEDSDTARTTNRVLGYAEQSPYTSMVRQARLGRQEDGSFSGNGS